MEFHHYTSFYNVAKKLGATQKGEGWKTFYERLLTSDIPEIAANQFRLEAQWHSDNCPYYLIWPGIIPALVRLRLDMDSGNIKAPELCLCLRLSVQHSPLAFEYFGQKYSIKTILINKALLMKGGKYDAGISIWIDIGEVVNQVPVLTFRNLICKEGITVEDSLDQLPIDPTSSVGVQIPDDIMLQCVKLCATICLLEKDPEIIEPDVLRADEQKFLQTGDMKYVEKAKRKGKFGWHVGRNVQVSPHVRGPSPAALYWTGPGRSIPLIRFRKGCIVHRKMVNRLPTGYEKNET